MVKAIASISEPSNFSVNYLYWTFIVNCFEVLNPSEIQVVSESTATHYGHMISLLCKVHEILVHKYDNQVNDCQHSNSCIELDPAIARLTSTFNSWFAKLECSFMDWKEKLINDELSIDDTLALFQYPKYVLAAVACGIMIDEGDVKRTIHKFRQITRCLWDIYLPLIPPQHDERFVI